MDIRVEKPPAEGLFDRILKNIKEEIDFCMVYGIDKDKTIPDGLIESLTNLYKGLEDYD